MRDEPEDFRLRDLPRHLREMRRSIVRAFALLWQTSRSISVALAVLTAIGGAASGLHVVFAKKIIDGVARAMQTGSAADRAQVYRWIAFEFGAVVLSTLVARATGMAESFLRMRLGQFVHERILEKTVSLALVDFENPEMQNRIDRARGGASYVPLDMLLSVFMAVQGALVLGAFATALFAVSGWMVLVIVVVSLAEFVINTRFSADSFWMYRERAEDSRRQAYLEAVLTRVDFAKEMKLFGLAPFLLERYRHHTRRVWNEDRARSASRNVWGALLSLASTATYYGAYAWIALRAMLNKISIGDLGMYTMVFARGQQEIAGVLHSVRRVYENHLYLGLLYELLEHESDDARDRGTLMAGPAPGDGIRFEHVSFAYPGSERPVLDDVSLHLPAGRKLALVGENGAGKTTLIKLLTRLYRPTSGRITLDGADIREWDHDALRKRMGVIFQDFIRYQFTVGENIGVGDVAALEDRARLQSAAESGTADEFIDKLPRQYDTQLGKWFDDGQDLSIGQWQKIALARAFMRIDADILILDEPTASIDAAAEARIFERFQALADKRTAVIISHRFSTVRMADIICVLADGKILESGSHDELIQRGGRYAELFFLQAKGYR